MLKSLPMLLWIGVLNAASLLEEQVQRQNTMIYTQLKTLAESDEFSKVNIPFNEQCPQKAEKCSALSCEVARMSFADKKGVIDLIKNPEGYSPHGKSGREVWERIYEAAKMDGMLGKLVSGIHFSVTTHISAYNKKILGWDISNPRYFKSRFKEEYQQNFLLFYTVLLNGFISLNNTVDIPQPAIQLAYEIKRQNLNITVPMITDGTLKGAASLIKELACLHCQKCRLWGTIQFRGLVAAIKAINGHRLTDLEVVCLVNTFRRVSVSERERRRLLGMWAVSWRMLFIYSYQLTLVLSLLFVLLLLHCRRQRLRSKELWSRL